MAKPEPSLAPPPQDLAAAEQAVTDAAWKEYDDALTRPQALRRGRKAAEPALPAPAVPRRPAQAPVGWQ